MFRVNTCRAVKIIIKHDPDRGDNSGYGDYEVNEMHFEVWANIYPITSPVVIEQYGLENKQPVELHFEAEPVAPDDIIAIDGREYILKDITRLTGYIKVICELKDGGANG